MVEIAVNCALCSKTLEAGLIEGEIFVRPCPRCQKTRVVRERAKRPEAGKITRYELKRSPARGVYVGQSKTGPLVKYSAAKKLLARIAWLEQCAQRLLSAAGAHFVTCPRCHLPLEEGYVCGCGYNHKSGDLEAFIL